MTAGFYFQSLVSSARPHEATYEMTYDETFAELQALGTAQNRKVYPRHGVREPLFGVSYANLGKLKKKIKADHALALELWDSGNHDARILATMIAEPQKATVPMLDAWACTPDNYVLTDAVSGFVGKTEFAGDCMRKWIDADAEYVEAAGWNLLGGSAMYAKGLSDSTFEPYIIRIERDIHGAKNRVRYAMYMALIAIGTKSDALEELAFAASTRVGRVEVDHGDTGCKTPEGPSYIRKARAHRRKKEG